MFRNILIPVDFTPKNESALDAAREIAAGGGSQVTLLHVIETLADTPFEEMQDFYRRLEERAREAIDGFGVRLAQDGIDARREVVYGKRTEEILAYAAKSGTDLVILSSHQVDAARPAQGWGTISHRVAILATCPVLLVK